MDMTQKLVEIVAEYREIDPAEIKTDVPFTELGLDSLDVAELAMKIEDELGLFVELSPKLNSIEKMAAYLETLH
ncbi:MAG: acyl carrier protein [Clostridia bacterium]|nr:acyl carrier protein [Clostridia bacterium]MBQ7316010.1 acyl carrier protein [Clostridia bacterium]